MKEEVHLEVVRCVCEEVDLEVVRRVQEELELEVAIREVRYVCRRK